ERITYGRHARSDLGIARCEADGSRQLFFGPDKSQVGNDGRSCSGDFDVLAVIRADLDHTSVINDVAVGDDDVARYRESGPAGDTAAAESPEADRGLLIVCESR